MKWHTERQDSGVLIIVEHDGKQWARLIRDGEFRDHYDSPWLFWVTIVNLKYAALGLLKTARVIADLSEDLKCQ